MESTSTFKRSLPHVFISVFFFPIQNKRSLLRLHLVLIDRVVIPILLRKLKRKGATNQLLHLINSLFGKCFSTLSVNYVRSNPFPRHRGLFQGSLLSPFLFNVYVDDLAQDLSQFQDSSSPIPAALLFADDIQLLPKNFQQAQSMLSIVDSWCLSNGMESNAKKSGYVGPATDWNLVLGGSPIPCPTSYTYLGLPVINSGIDWHSYVKKCLEKAGKTLKYIQVKGNRWPPIIRLQLFKTFVRSLWEYCSPLVYLAAESELINDIQNFQDKALSWVANQTDATGKKYKRLIQSITAIEKIKDRFENLGIRFGLHYSKVLDSNPLKKMISFKNSNSSFVTSSALIFKNIHYSDEFKKYLKINSSCPTDECVTITEFVRKRKLVSLSKVVNYKDRINLIESHHRHPVSLIDSSFYIKDPFISRQAIHWRISNFGYGYQCPQCKRLFTYKHTSSCFNIQNLDSAFSFETIDTLTKVLRYLTSKVMPSLKNSR